MSACQDAPKNSAQDLLRSGHFQALAEMLEQLQDKTLAQIPPECVDAALTWQVDQCRFDDVNALYQRAQRLEISVELPRGLAQQMMRMNRPSDAVDLLNEWRATDNKDAASFAKQVLALQTMRADQAALSICKKARTKFPSNDQLALSEVILSLRLGVVEPVLDTLKALSSRRDQPLWIHALLRALQSDEIDAMGLSLSVPRELVSPKIILSLARGLYEIHERNALLANLMPHDRVLELGTGLGAMACWANQRQPEVPFVSIEANPSLAPLIMENFKRNNCTAQAISGVAALHEGYTEFNIEGDFWASSQVTGSPMSTSVKLPCVSIPDLLAEFRPTIMVVDIEGAEADLLPGLSLQSVRRLIVEMHPQFIPLADCAKLWRKLIDDGFYPQQAKGSDKVVVWNRITDSKAHPSEIQKGSSQ